MRKINYKDSEIDLSTSMSSCNVSGVMQFLVHFQNVEKTNGGVLKIFTRNLFRFKSTCSLSVLLTHFELLNELSCTSKTSL